MKSISEGLLKDVRRLPTLEWYGKVTAVTGMLIEAVGVSELTSVGSRCYVDTRHGERCAVEVVGFQRDTTLLMPFSGTEGIGMGCKVWVQQQQSAIHPSEAWKGRIINAMAEPIDQKGLLKMGEASYPLRNVPPIPSSRQMVAGKLDMGVRAVNTFLTCCRGQRMGIFSGSGVGKSTLISMLAKYSQADVKVIGLIGERGREVQEFIHHYLGEEGLQNAVIVVATGDQSPLMRRQAAYVTLSVAEYFRDQGQQVLCMMDSVTRFAMAQREIGLSVGEPPATKGYTPTVFAELPKLLERAGPGEGQGMITGIFTVLVEGDDHNEPISDAVRGILDGHIVLERSIAERGRFPAIDVLKSVSRTMPGCNNDEENALVVRSRNLLATYENMADLIRLGAYKAGSDPKVDEAIHYYDALEAFLAQAPKEYMSLEECYLQLGKILNGGG